MCFINSNYVVMHLIYIELTWHKFRDRQPIRWRSKFSVSVQLLAKLQLRPNLPT